MINTRYKMLLTAIPLSLMMVACASTPSQQSGKQTQKTASSERTYYQVTENYTSGVISYTVQSGDHLSDISREFTGVPTNWNAIAKYNNLKNPNNLRKGQVLKIPTKLVASHKRSRSNRTAASNSANPGTQTSSLAVRRQSAAVAPVLITPVKNSRGFDLNPIDAKTQNQSRSYSGSETKIKVVGSYYPKGIYTQPAYHSKLVMRVTPGATFSLVSQVNDWYRIQLNNGLGYIRTSDAAIVK